MVTRIVHFGANDSERLMALARVGYAVEPNGESIPNFQEALRQGQFDAIFVGQDCANSINKGTVVPAQKSPVPLILFAGGNRRAPSSAFDLVVSPNCPEAEWMNGVAQLLEKSRAIEIRSKLLCERSALLQEQAAHLREDSKAKVDRVRIEREKSRQGRIARQRNHELRTTGTAYKTRLGFVVICSMCKKTRRVDDPSRWDWVPTHLDRRLPKLSHGLCLNCQPYVLQRNPATGC